MEINKNVDEIMTKANTLIEALPYIRRFNGATIIVKYGGSSWLTQAAPVWWFRPNRPRTKTP